MVLRMIADQSHFNLGMLGGGSRLTSFGHSKPLQHSIQGLSMATMLQRVMMLVDQAINEEMEEE